MTTRYSDSENETKSATRADWKIDLMRTYFADGVKDPEEARKMIRGWGYVLKLVPLKNGKKGRLDVQVLDVKGQTVLQFECLSKTIVKSA